MISIITAIRNQMGMNRLFLEYLNKYSSLPYELIVIDNGSSDGSADFFESNGAKVIRNNGNYSYPYCQNQGIKVAKYDYFAFLNNDILVCPDWDAKLLAIMSAQSIDFISPATIDCLENAQETKKLNKQWKFIKYPLIFLGGHSYQTLKIMHQIMYKNWEAYTAKRFLAFKDNTIEAFSGSAIITTRKGMNSLGGFWDERIQSADFDLYMQVRKRSMEIHDVKPMQLALGIYFHHYSRLTLRSKHFVPFIDEKNLISIQDKWGDETDMLLEKIEWS